MAEPILIPDRGEFVDALERLRRGHVMVRIGDAAGDCVIDGSPVYTAYRPLIEFELVAPYDNPSGFEALHYYRLTPQGHQFAERVCSSWRGRPLLERLAMRLTG